MTMSPINNSHRYIIRNGREEWVSSTDDLGIALPPGFGLIDTVGVDGLGSVAGNKGIAAFRRAKAKGRQP